MPVRGIQFTQEQALLAVDISRETLRHWRKMIPYLAERSGKAARFSFSDLVALAITREIIESFGVSIASVEAGIETLFRVLAAARPGTLQTGVVIMTSATTKLYRRDQTMKLEHSVATLVVPCETHVLRMRERVVPGLRLNQQPGLPFLPRAVRK